MPERTDTERLDWMLDQNKKGAIMFYVTDRRDVDELMADDERSAAAPLVTESAGGQKP